MADISMAVARERYNCTEKLSEVCLRTCTSHTQLITGKFSGMWYNNNYLFIAYFMELSMVKIIIA